MQRKLQVAAAGQGFFGSVRQLNVAARLGNFIPAVLGEPTKEFRAFHASRSVSPGRIRSLVVGPYMAAYAWRERGRDMEIILIRKMSVYPHFWIPGVFDQYELQDVMCYS